MEPLVGTAALTPCALSNHWIQACSIWVKHIEKLCNNFDYSDAPWEYLERTNSAIFAGSLTESGVPSMPETYVMRDNKDQKNERVDICSINSDKLIELIELKLVEFDINRTKNLKNVDSKLRTATTQVINITGIYGIPIKDTDHIKRIVGAIGLPCFEVGTDVKLMQDAIQNLIKELRNSAYAVKAWVFPSKYIGKPSIRFSKFYPGTFVVARPA